MRKQDQAKKVSFSSSENQNFPRISEIKIKIIQFMEDRLKATKSIWGITMNDLFILGYKDIFSEEEVQKAVRELEKERLVFVRGNTVVLNNLK